MPEDQSQQAEARPDDPGKPREVIAAALASDEWQQRLQAARAERQARLADKVVDPPATSSVQSRQDDAFQAAPRPVISTPDTTKRNDAASLATAANLSWESRLAVARSQRDLAEPSQQPIPPVPLALRADPSRALADAPPSARSWRPARVSAVLIASLVALVGSTIVLGVGTGVWFAPESTEIVAVDRPQAAAPPAEVTPVADPPVDETQPETSSLTFGRPARSVRSLGPEGFRIAEPESAVPAVEPVEPVQPLPAPLPAVTAPATSTARDFAAALQALVAALPGGARVHLPSAAADAAGQNGVASDGRLTLLSSSLDAGRDSVAYFHTQDQAAAMRAADMIGAELVDYTAFSPRPAPGTVEVWLTGEI